MPLKLNVGVCRKIGQPDYGSIGASCNVELELESSLLQHDLDGFHKRVRQAYSACQQAVADQLARHHQADGPTTSGSQRRAPSRPAPAANPPQNGGAATNGNGSGGRQATEKQLTYIRQLSSQIKGLGVRRLDTLAGNMYGKPVVELTSFEASGLIDCMKGIKADEIDLQAALNGAKT